MANNQIKMVYFVHHLFFVLLLFSTSTMHGQNISKHYTSSLQDNGTLYFIFPQKGFASKETNGTLIYDITYLTGSDTATVNFSYFDISNRNIDSIAFVCANKTYSSNINKIFIETKNNQWHYRYTSKALWLNLQKFFYQSDKPKIILYTQQGNIELTIKKNIWKKQSAISKKILTLIKYNQ